MKKASFQIKKLIGLLNDGHFHSGSDLGQKLGVSRAAICKLVQQLIADGIQIKAVRGKGYCLPEALGLLDEALIKTALIPSVCSKVEVFTSISSTQDYIKNTLKEASGNSFCLAESQTKARGRMGRSWVSGFGQNLCFSYLWHTEKDLSELGGLSLIVGLALLEALPEFGIKPPAKIKWPNDIICRDKKMAGILLEVSSEAHQCTQVIIGIGLNVNMTETDQDITQAWTSLKQQSQKNYDRNQLIIHLMKKLFEYLKQFESQGLESFMELWQQHDYLYHKNIKLLLGDKPISGKAMGINSQGLLKLELNNGELKSFASGEVSIKLSE